MSDLNEVKLKIDTFSYSWGKKRNKAYLYVKGRVEIPGVDCQFSLEINRKGYSLTFPKAVSNNAGEDLLSLARTVKSGLLWFLRSTDEVPEAHRQALCDCVLNHHLQKGN